MPLSPFLAGLTLFCGLLFAIFCIMLAAIYRRFSNRYVQPPIPRLMANGCGLALMASHLNCRRSDSNLKVAKHTQLTIPADCQLDPLHPGGQTDGPGNHQPHHSLLPLNCDGRSAVDCSALGDVGVGGGGVGLDGGMKGSSPIGLMAMPGDTLRSNARTRHSPMADQADIDDTDPDVIPNQYGEYFLGRPWK